MNSIFTNVKFGDKFMTRDGRKALFVGIEAYDTYRLWIKERDIEAFGEMKYNSDGKCIEDFSCVENYDIISKCNNEVPTYTYEQMATLNLQLQGLVDANNEAYYKILAEKEYLKKKIRLIEKVLKDE